MTRYAQTIPLQQFSLNGGLITTYGRCTYIENEPVIIREAQILKSSNNSWAIIDGRLPNDRSGVVLYTKDSKEYCTALGEDGILNDLYQIGDVNAPSELSTSGILAMSNNQNSNAPFILLQYANGGVAGYNYMTEEVIFDHSIRNLMDLKDYLAVYFEGDDSILSDVASSYSSNARVAQSAGTPERLNAMVSGNSSGENISGNNTGENISNGIAAGSDVAYGTVVAAGSEVAGGTIGQSGSSTTTGSSIANGDNVVDGDIVDSNGSSTSGDADAAEKGAGTTQSKPEGDTTGATQSKPEGDTTGTTQSKPEGDTQDKSESEASKDSKEDSKDTSEGMTGSNLSELSGYMPEIAEPVAVVTADQLFTVYNQDTGCYEIVDVQQFLTAPAYVSENSRLAVQNLGSYAGYAEKEKQQTTDGLGLYILVSMALVSGLAVIVVWRKKQKKA